MTIDLNALTQRVAGAAALHDDLVAAQRIASVMIDAGLTADTSPAMIEQVIGYYDACDGHHDEAVEALKHAFSEWTGGDR